MPIEVTVKVNDKSLAEFADIFQVHPTTPEEFAFTITTVPADAEVKWILTPKGSFCGESSPSQGETKSIAFKPKNAQRPTKGSKSPNAPIEFTLKITATKEGEKEVRSFAVVQSKRATLRQEYLDFGLQPPSLDQIVVLSDAETPHFKALEFLGKSNYHDDRLGVKGGMQEIAEETRTTYGRGIQINSAYRNPQRNKAVGGVPKSVHQSGGALDMIPVPADLNVANKVALYRAAILSAVAKLVLLEKGPSQLLPGNWNPPPATHIFTHEGTQITVGDSDGDGLPDQVTSISNPAAGILNNVLFGYDGGKTVNPPFRIGSESVPPKKIVVGDPLHLVWRPPNPKFLPGRSSAQLKEYFELATHIHADSRQLPKLLSDPPDLKQDEFDPFGTVGQSQEIPFKSILEWGSVANVQRLMRTSLSGTETEIYKKIDDTVKPRREEIASILKKAIATRRDLWGQWSWPVIERINPLDWDYDTIVIHHAGDGFTGDHTPQGIEAKHRSPPNEILSMNLGGRGWADIGYHFLVDRDGRIYEARSLLFEGAHAGEEANANFHKVGVLVIGDFEPGLLDPSDDELSQEQMDATRKLITAIRDAFPGSMKFLGGHRDFRHTKCPGELLYAALDQLRTDTGLSKPNP